MAASAKWRRSAESCLGGSSKYLEAKAISNVAMAIWHLAKAEKLSLSTYEMAYQ